MAAAALKLSAQALQGLVQEEITVPPKQCPEGCLGLVYAFSHLSKQEKSSVAPAQTPDESFAHAKAELCMLAPKSAPSHPSWGKSRSMGQSPLRSH